MRHHTCETCTWLPFILYRTLLFARWNVKRAIHSEMRKKTHLMTFLTPLFLQARNFADFSSFFLLLCHNLALMDDRESERLFFLLIRLEFNWHMALLCISKYILALFWLLPRFRLWFYGSFFTSFSFSLSIKVNWYYLELLMQQLWFLQKSWHTQKIILLLYKNIFLNFFIKKYVMKNHSFCIYSYTFSVKKKILKSWYHAQTFFFFIMATIKSWQLCLFLCSNQLEINKIHLSCDGNGMVALLFYT